ncbi:MAG: Holliday junction branch migration protein RuvA [Lysobacterales bacterium]|nr:MAG: Holliday junction branch migration protein RuvA [Xanthomonadales bacterium]
MIASLRGVIQAINEQSLILEVNGVGYLVNVPATLAQPCYALGDTLLLYTHLHLRENDIALYGFRTRSELELFLTLLTVPGIGPRTALAVIAMFSPETLRQAISQGDITALTQVPGIGRKTAQRLLVDLNDKIVVGHNQEFGLQLSPMDSDAVNALTALGYSIVEAQQALRQVPIEVSQLDERIIAALRYLGSH